MSTAKLRRVYGGGVRIASLAASTRIDPERARYWSVAAPASGRVLRLPDEARFAEGGPWLTVSNIGSEPIDAEDIEAETVATIAAGQTVELYVIAGKWNALPIGTAGGGGVAAPPAPTSDSITITEHTFNVNLRDLFDARGYAGQLGFEAIVTIAPGIHIGSTDAAIPALDTGVWHASTLIRLNLGAGSTIDGKGGDGGNAALSFNLPGNPGGDGGTAVKLRAPTLITAPLSAEFRGGGGGGGGGASSDDSVERVGGGGGGGGQGRTGGLPGTTLSSDASCVPPPDGSNAARPGDATGPGSPGQGTIFTISGASCNTNGFTGGAGGGWGAAGVAGGSTGGLSGGAGGAGGLALEGLAELDGASTLPTITGGTA